MRLIFLFSAFLMAACLPAMPPPANQTDAESLSQLIVSASTPVPTANLLPTQTATLPPTQTSTPSRTPTPSPSFTPTSTQTPSPTWTATIPLIIPPTNTRIPSATPTEVLRLFDGTSQPTWTPPPLNPETALRDHYYFRRPVGDNGVNWIDRTYPYGSTSGGRLPIHHGVEFVNPRGTPLFAVADGVVVYAGDDLTTLFGPYNNYYGNLVVIEHPFLSPEGLPVFSLYGHMDRVSVETGQAVREGDNIGTVGGTGIAMGPHLHFEVRLGNPYDFGATRNPELWIRPFPMFGTLAGRVTDANGALLYDVTLRVQSSDISRYAFSYAGDSVNSDDTFGENFTLGDLPANYYMVTVSESGRVRFQEIVYVHPNRTTWLEVRLRP